jgi:hypothetical protein
MSKEQTPITAEEFLRQCGTGEEYIPWIALRMEQYASKSQNNLIADIKDKVSKLEENTNTTDFAFDVINLLKSIKPLTNE